jgi:cellulose synthase/poly-beta-1,6-N-acetylglucosamine synthase-like glycosyltransferase
MILLYYLFAALLVYMSYKSFRGGLEYLNYFKQELTKQRGSYAPFATVIVPCKGIDDGLHGNLAALMIQDHPDYEVIFVLDSENDPAADVINDVRALHSAALSARRKPPSKVVIAPRTTESSQKVENLREAVLHADDRSEVFVFADSDARPADDWLAHLVAPLSEDKIGATTGYRWFIADRPTFGSELRSAWNASIASALGPDSKKNFCWGGSMAIRRETFERLQVREHWRGTVSDDFTLRRVLHEADLNIYFVPQALTASPGNCSLRETIEFTNRQIKLTRVYASHFWKLSFFGSIVFNTVIAASILIILFSRVNDAKVVVAISTLALVAIFSTGKSWVRFNAAKLVLADRWPSVRHQWLTQNTLWLITPVLFLVNCIAASVSRDITWRGIRYRLISARETVIITD